MYKRQTLSPVVRKIIFIPGTNEIALGSGSLACAFTPFEVACTQMVLTQHCTANVEDTFATAILWRLVKCMNGVVERVSC